MIGQLVAVLFLGRDLAHREHLRVSGPGSYAKHVALGAFYEDIIGLADDLAEAYQGRHGIIDKIPLLGDEGRGEIVATLKGQLSWIETNRFSAIPESDTPLQNIVDEVCAKYLSTIYKLENLQ